jgi:hypothetical protein
MKLSSALLSAISDSLNLQPTTDGEGYVWQPPAVLPELRDEAAAAAAALKAALAPASKSLKTGWLMKLGMLCASSANATDAKNKIVEYAAAIDHPPLCFTDGTGTAAARQFKFFPSFSELCQFLDAEARPHRDRLRRLERVATAPPMGEQESEAERIRRRQEMGDKLGLLKRALRGDAQARRALGFPEEII